MKRIISILLSLILLSGICGCTDEKVTSSSNENSNPTSSESYGKEEIISSEPNNNTSQNTDDKPLQIPNNSFETLIEESDGVQQIPIPGTENWSNDPDAYVLSVSNESIGNFSYYGWYVTESMSANYAKMTETQKKQYLEYIFEGEQCNYISLMVDSRFYYQSEETGFDIEYFKEQMCLGDGGLLDEFIKKDIPIFACLRAIPKWMQDKKPFWLQKKYADTFAQSIANMVYDLRIECGLNIVNVGIGDEPDGMSGDWDSRNVSHFHDVLPLITKYLKANGMGDVGIIGPETCVISHKWLNTLRSNPNTLNNLFAFSGHNFNLGGVNDLLFNTTRVLNKPLFITSMGILDEHTVAGNFLTVNENGEETIADYYTAMRNISPLLNNINKGANLITMWSPSVAIENITRLDVMPPNFYHIFYNENGEVFEKNLATSATYYYYSQALNTVKPGSKIYQCSNDKDGTMGASFENYIINATAGINPDGTWGINIFNKTDSTIAKPYADQAYAPKPQAERTIIVNLDIKGLYGTGSKEFKMYSTNTSGGYNEELGTVTLVDGRGTVEVFPLELLSLRSVESIKLNNKPMAIKQVIKRLNIAYVDNNYMVASGEKQNLMEAPKLVYYNDYANCGIKFNIKDFASIIGAKYEIVGNTVTVFNDTGYLKFIVGDKLVKYSGNIDGTFQLPDKMSLIKGEYYFELTDTMSGNIGKIFGIHYTQYENTGLVVVGETDIVNLGRFSQLFK